jgi:hypothetical protein
MGNPDMISKKVACHDGMLRCSCCYTSTGSTTSAFQQNVTVDCAAILSRIREFPGSNLGLETGYSDSGFSWPSLVLPVGQGKKLSHDRFLPCTFQFIIYHSRYIVYAIESVVKYTII